MANVHKDFHGALSFALGYLEEECGREGREAFLAGLAGSVYRPLVEALKARGLPALREHWETIFRLEEGDIEFEEGEEVLVLRVWRCPAIAHMKTAGYPVSAHFCEHTRIVNAAVCAAAGYHAEVDYDQEAGRCVQRFWRTPE